MTREHVDWTVLTPEVMEVVNKAASSVASAFQGVIEAADLAQEAYIQLALEWEKTQQYIDNGELGLLYNRTRQRMWNYATGQAGYSNRVVSTSRFVDMD